MEEIRRLPAHGGPLRRYAGTKSTRTPDMRKHPRFFMFLFAWLALAVVLAVRCAFPPDSVLWWLLVAPPAVAVVAILAGGFVVTVLGLVLALLAGR